MSESEKTSATEKPAGKFLSDRSKQVGRDGAYLEVESKGLLESLKDGELLAANMIVITDSRMDISDPDRVEELKAVVEKVASGFYDDDLKNMDDRQRSLFVVRKIVEMGISALAKACGVAKKED